MDQRNEQQEKKSGDGDKGKIGNDERNLVVAFIQFLRYKVSSNQCTDDQIEGLEVAVQCLETAFGITDKNYAFQSSKPLLDMFVAAEGLPGGDEAFPIPTPAEIEQANKLKEEGNELVKTGDYDTAVAKYNEAIKLNRDPIYFCNRAAVYCRLEQFDLAIQDCRTALALDPNYAKAYGRMGVALSCQNRYDEAVLAYKKALELDPNNESYRQNLSIAEAKLAEAQNTMRNNPQANPLGGLGNLFGNPQMMEMATRMMTDPGMQNMMQSMMQNFMGGGGEGAGPPGPGLEGFLRAGERFAHQMEQANPAFVDQLRNYFGGPPDNGGGQGQDQQPGNGSSGGGGGNQDGAPKPEPPPGSN